MVTLIIFALSVFCMTASAENLLVEDSCGMMIGNSPQSPKRFNYTILGHDYDGIPVMLFNWGAWDLLWLVNNENEKERFARNYEKCLSETESAILLRRFNMETTDFHVMIIDFDGFDHHQVFSQAVQKLMRQIFIFKSNLQSRPGVFTLAYGIILNANPVADQMISTIKPFVGDLLEHFEVYGTNSKKWIPRLLKLIPANQLPPALGGTKEYKPIATCDLV